MKTRWWVFSILVALVGAFFVSCGKSPTESASPGQGAAASPATNAAPQPVTGAAVSPPPAAMPDAGLNQGTTFYAKPGGKMRIDGTANMIHPHWAVESPIIGGTVQAGPNFPAEPGQAATPGKLDAKVEAFVDVRSLKSVEKDGSHYSDSMDDIMYGKLLPSNAAPKITFKLTELTLKEAAKDKDSPYLCDAQGDLTVAGVTKPVSFAVKILPMTEKKLKISGSTAVKMTDFKIEPPAPKITFGIIKTGDEVKLTFDWIVQQRAPAAK